MTTSSSWVNLKSQKTRKKNELLRAQFWGGFCRFSFPFKMHLTSQNLKVNWEGLEKTFFSTVGHFKKHNQCQIHSRGEKLLKPFLSKLGSSVICITKQVGLWLGLKIGGWSELLKNTQDTLVYLITIQLTVTVSHKQSWHLGNFD